MVAELIPDAGSSDQTENVTYAASSPAFVYRAGSFRESGHDQFTASQSGRKKRRNVMLRESLIAILILLASVFADCVKLGSSNAIQTD